MIGQPSVVPAVLMAQKGVGIHLPVAGYSSWASPTSVYCSYKWLDRSLFWHTGGRPHQKKLRLSTWVTLPVTTIARIDYYINTKTSRTTNDRVRTQVCRRQDSSPKKPDVCAFFTLYRSFYPSTSGRSEFSFQPTYISDFFRVSSSGYVSLSVVFMYMIDAQVLNPCRTGLP